MFTSPPITSATRDGFGKGIVTLAQKNKDVVVLNADLVESLRLNDFVKKFPDRFIQVGVAEQNLAGTAAGLALGGKIPFATSFAAFSPGRNFDQIRVSICYSNLNVKIVSSHAGLNLGKDGASHQMLEDIALMRTLPNMTVIVPADAQEAEQATLALGQHQGPAYLRLTREKYPVITRKKTFTIGQAEILSPGKDLTIIGSGPILTEVFKAKESLEKEAAYKNISLEIINLSTIKPLDYNTLQTSLEKTKALVTVEEHQLAGGVGSTILEALAENNFEHSIPIEMVAVRDTFGESGSPADLWKKYQLDANHIQAAIVKVLEKKHNKSTHIKT